MSEDEPHSHYHRRRNDLLEGEQGAAPLYSTHQRADDATQHEYMPHETHPEMGHPHPMRRREDIDPPQDPKDAGEDKKDDKKDGDKKDEDAKKKKPMSRHKKRLFIIGGIILAIILITGAVLYWLHARHFEDTDDAFVDGHIAQVSPQVTGRVLQLDIVDNQIVEAGQLLLEIDPRDFEVRLAQAKAQRAQAVAQTQQQEANIAQAEANVSVAQAEDDRAEQDFARYRHVDVKAVSRQQVDQAKATAKTAQAKLDAAQQSVEEAKAQLQSSKAAIEQADADIANASLQLSYTKVVAPFAGKVTKRTAEPGNIVTAGQPLLAIVSPDLWVTANFKETQLTDMKIGQKVRIQIDTFPDIKFAGHVDSFQTGSGSAFSSLPAENATGNYVKVVQRVPVKILFDDAEQRDKYRIAPGMSVVPRVEVR